MRHLRGAVHIETTDMLITADEVDWNQDTGDVEARGHVHFESFTRGQKLDCDSLDYNIDDETGKFYNVKGTSPSTIQARPGLLTTQNPFYFQAKWVEKLKDHYILHDGLLTDCLLPRPWWILRGPEFDVVPGDHAIARHSWFYLKRLPLFYTPWFYKSLKKEPRRSGFLIPNIGNSSAHGKMFGVGYFWAINRSYDLTYRALDFTQAGVAQHAELRGKINQKSDFDLSVFGIKDTQQEDFSGYRVNLLAKSDLGNGWEARGDLDYLSSLNFLQQFTQSFNEAVQSETNSVGFVTKHWSDFGANFVASRIVNFQSTTPGDTIEIQKLPSAEFTGREREIDFRGWPFWVSFQSSAGLLHRGEPGFDLLPAYQTADFVSRIDLAPQVSTAFHWRGLQLIPTFGIRETEYGQSMQINPDGTQAIGNQALLRSSRDVTLDLLFPSLERIYDAPSWMGQKVKHIIEPRVTYKYVTGIDDFDRIIRFDENDLLTDTNQLEFSLTNRLLAKDKNGTVTDYLTWQLGYERYFDPTFGGAVQPCGTTGLPSCQRNVIESEIDLTGFAFLDQPRNYSPVVSVLRMDPLYGHSYTIGFEWRTDYDPLRKGITNSSVSLDARYKKYAFSIGHTDIHADPVLAPSANQLHALIRYGDSNGRGWNYGYQAFYDYKKGTFQYWDAQATYNTDCCGLSIQYRRFYSIGARSDSQIQAAFAISNIGTFGTLKRQDRIF